MIITIWGNAGSGKSTLSIKLANAFAAMRKNVLLIDTNFVCPQINIWYPAMNITKEKSLANLLDNKIESEETIISKINIVSENIGVIGYAKDFSSSSMPNRDDTAKDLLSMLNQSKKLCDIVIVDCTSDIYSSIFTSTAILDAENSIRIIAVTPDLRGLSWYDSNVRMMEEAWMNNNQPVIKVFNQVHITAPVTDIENIIGTVDYYLPYDADLRREMYTGILGENKSRKTAKKYSKVIDSIASRILFPAEVKTGK